MASIRHKSKLLSRWPPTTALLQQLPSWQGLTSISSRTALSAERMAADATSSAEAAELSAAWARSSSASHCRKYEETNCLLGADSLDCQQQYRRGANNTRRTAQRKQAQGGQTSHEHAARIMILCSVKACRWP